MNSRKIIISILISAVCIFSSQAQISTQSLKFGEVFEKISNYYVDTINEDKFVEEVIVQMLHDLDPHSSYLSKDEVKAMQEPLDGNFEGIGVSFNIMKDTIFIINTISGGPAERVGIRGGDRIVKIDSLTVAGTGITNTDVQKKLKGKKGSKVQVSIARRNVQGLLDFTITRDEIPIYSIDASYMVDDKTGYIKLSRFSMTSVDEFYNAISKLEKQGLQNLILDLSGNGGGYLRIAVELADQFIDGKNLLVYTEGAKNPRHNYYSTDRGEFQKGKLVVMIDESSASASEIVAGALQDLDRAVIVGRRSFGKGLVQQPFGLMDGSMIRLTIAKYYTPTGRLIQKPYDKGFDEYSKEITERFFSTQYADTAVFSFPDSLKYRTLNKNRVVYGGGGIMPDYFVSYDTSYFSGYYRDLISKGILNQFILNYGDKNRSKLKAAYPGFNEFRKSFTVSEEMLNSLIEYAEDEGVSYNENDFRKSEYMIRHLCKAYLARDIWETSEFFQIYNESDPIFKRAVQVMEEGNLYEKKLEALKP
ncbi:MAG: S41 family peptidase [Bacteroidales bacterium]|nr:S41 family peptidase [Bacteroidales bacterium]MCB9013284.1 S41 family peptidase [Bacteroidales bacterium]